MTSARISKAAVKATAISGSPCEILLRNAEPALAPEARGMNPNHDRLIRTFVKAKGLVVVIRNSNPHSARYAGSAEYVAKPRDLSRCRSITSGPNAGMVACPPDLFESEAAWLAELARLKQEANLHVGDSKTDYLVTDGRGRPIISDYDLVGIYSAADGSDKYNYDLRVALNTHIQSKMFRHGPLDHYSGRHQIGFRSPMTAYLPNGHAISLRSKIDLERLYVYYKIDFARIWQTPPQPHVQTTLQIQ